MHCIPSGSVNNTWIYSCLSIKNNWLVALTILKNIKVNGKDEIPYVKWIIKFMFETTNQLCIVLYTKATVNLPSGSIWLFHIALENRL